MLNIETVIKTENNGTLHVRGDYELCPRYDRRRSFYGKARMIEAYNEALQKVYLLKSYDTIVCAFNRGTQQFIRLWDDWSHTTGRHINEFSRQCTGNTMRKKDWDQYDTETL